MYKGRWMGMRGWDNGELVGVACYKSGSAEKSDLVLLGSKTELVKVADIIQIIYLITKPILLFGILTRALSFRTYFTFSHLFTQSHFHCFILSTRCCSPSWPWQSPCSSPPSPPPSPAGISAVVDARYHHHHNHDHNRNLVECDILIFKSIDKRRDERNLNNV